MYIRFTTQNQLQNQKIKNTVKYRIYIFYAEHTFYELLNTFFT